MKNYFYLFVISFYCYGAMADDLNFANREQMKQYALNQCTLDQPQACDCMANMMVDKFSDIDWKLFVAAVTKDESIKQQVTDQNILDFSDKLYTIVINCEPS